MSATGSGRTNTAATCALGSFRDTPSSSPAASARHHLPDGTLLDPKAVAGAVFFVFVAGRATTGQFISTVLHRALAECGAWVEAVLRREPPVVSWHRVTARPLELSGGVGFPAGAEPLLILVGSGSNPVVLMGSGSDPVVFDSPGQVVPGRANTLHHLASPWGATPPRRGAGCVRRWR
ncbi:hypothetical protein ACFQ7A_16200 [Streptomyces sp. NPDC056528]|uniref:hypothetical protein n=1 Tax=Streptomyces sp. NPDC056528 TaxID=3345854 RepID=UPI003697F585